MEKKKWYLSKTIWFAVLTAIVGILTSFNVVYPEAGWLVTIIGVINMFLRLNTESGIK